MIKVDNRESAHLRSRVIDRSVVPNVVSYTGLFAAITPVAKLQKNEAGLYDPILIRDTDSLIANFGDPRVDPEKYIDLYTIMQMVGNGTSCYVAKVPSGNTGEYELAFIPEDSIIDKDSINVDIGKIVKTHHLTDKEATIDNLYNKYIISDVYGHRNEQTSSQATNALLDRESGQNHIKFTAVNAGAAGNNIYVKITGDSTAGFDLFIGDHQGLGEDDLVLENVTDFDSLNSDLVTVEVVGDIFEVQESQLAGGSDKVIEIPEKDWKLDAADIKLDWNPTTDPNPVWELNIKVNTTETIDSIVIHSAELDPNYGRENIVLTPDDPSDRKTYHCNDLDHKYSIIQINDGSTIIPSDSYTVEWATSGNNKYNLHINFADDVTDPIVSSASRQQLSIIAYSSMSEKLDLRCKLIQAKPTSLDIFYLVIEAWNNDNLLGTAKVKLEDSTTNQGLVNAINSSLGTYVTFELADQSDDNKSAAKGNINRDLSIVYNLLNKYESSLSSSNYVIELPSPSVLATPNFSVELESYVNTLMQYKDRKYTGCILSDLTAPVTDADNNNNIVQLEPDERRSLHYNLKQIACERKDCTVILSTPYYKSKTNLTPFTLDEICQWVSSTGNYTDLWEYGEQNTTDYSLQSFYLEMYYSWLNLQCTKIENSVAKSVKVKVAPSNLVIENILRSFRERGVQFPVAGDQYGTLTSQATILQNPASKLDRDQLVQYRINPIWDTGTRGIQIYGNETLNAGYTDLNAAHIARTIVYIRSRIDEYTETLKFLINSQILWDNWKNYVTMNILQPLQGANAISSYRVRMGNDTTTREEIANRTINGIVELTFYQSAEIFDLSFIVYSSATTVEEANPI